MQATHGEHRSPRATRAPAAEPHFPRITSPPGVWTPPGVWFLPAQAVPEPAPSRQPAPSQGRRLMNKRVSETTAIDAQPSTSRAGASSGGIAGGGSGVGVISAQPGITGSGAKGGTTAGGSQTAGGVQSAASYESQAQQQGGLVVIASGVVGGGYDAGKAFIVVRL